MLAVFGVHLRLSTSEQLVSHVRVSFGVHELEAGELVTPIPIRSKCAYCVSGDWTSKISFIYAHCDDRGLAPNTKPSPSLLIVAPL